MWRSVFVAPTGLVGGWPVFVAPTGLVGDVEFCRNAFVEGVLSPTGGSGMRITTDPRFVPNSMTGMDRCNDNLMSISAIWNAETCCDLLYMMIDPST